MCLIPQAWEGTSSEELVMVDMKDEAGDIYEYKDRRQEIVIIGHRMKRDNIQGLLDKCLLTDEEMAARVRRKQELLARKAGPQRATDLPLDYNPEAGVNLRAKSINDNLKESLQKQADVQEERGARFWDLFSGQGGEAP